MGLRGLLEAGGIMKKLDTPVVQQQADESLKPSVKTKGTTKPSKVVADDEDTPTPKVVNASSKEMLKTLQKSLRSEAGDGFDYLKFSDTVKKMEAHIPDEAARYSAAGVSAESMKVIADDLIESAQGYIKILNKQEASFTTAMQDSEAEVAEDEDKLKDIHKQIETLQSQEESLTQKIADTKAEVAENRASFEAAFAQVADGIKQDISKIKKYLKN